MSETKWTKGPWIYDRGVDVVEVAGGDGPAIADLHTSGVDLDVENRANGHLIAAAPELYAALLDVIAENTGQPKSCGCKYSCIHTGDNAMAALAKARGAA